MEINSFLKKTIAIAITLVCNTGIHAQWSQISANTDDLYSVFFISSDTGYVTGGNAKILKTTDGGITWTSTHNGGGTITKICFINADTGYAISDNAVLYKTIDKGQSWTSHNLPNGYYFGLDFINDSTGFISGQNSNGDGCVLKTTDFGASWSLQNYLATSRINDIDMITQSIGYAAGYSFVTSQDGIIYKSIDGGNSWVPQIISLSPQQLSFFCLQFTDSLTGYIAGNTVGPAGGNSGIVYKTNDGGTTWSSQLIPSASFIMDIQFVTDSIGYMAGTLDGSSGCGTSLILKTINAGNTWLVENTGPSIYGVNSLHFPNPDYGYALERCSGTGAVGGILKYNSHVNCFAYYGVSVDSATSAFTLFIDSATYYQAVSYLWDFGDGTTSTLVNPTHVVNIDTVYNVCMKIFTAAGDSCQYCHLLGKDYLSNIIRDQGFTINVENPNNITTDIHSKGLNNCDVLVYPNPANGLFNIKLNNPKPYGICNVFDITGKLVLTKHITNTNFQVDLSNENGSIYILEIIDRNNVSRIKLGKK